MCTLSNFQMRSNPNLIEAPSPVIGYFKLDSVEEEGANGTGAENHAVSATVPTMAAVRSGPGPAGPGPDFIDIFLFLLPL